MCRLLAIKDRAPFAIAPWLRAFAAMARASREYQGDGWGCAWRDAAGWRVYRSVTPIWDDDLEPFATTTLLVAHARSAFRNEGIAVENNMPFLAGGVVFAFNGELHGVRIREAGRIGAEKVFNVVRRFARADLAGGLARATEFIRSRSRYVRALNVVVSAGDSVVAQCAFGEQPDYFTLHVARGDGRVAVCSEPLAGAAWAPMANGAVEVLA
ncbi:MAG TPA: class II glutamine amidotransferase [Thermoanaerobaculaceae bacterium]|nr:class II glutamine amidotransferase [Thermoanaerobaculaceae bacterium]